MELGFAIAERFEGTNGFDHIVPIIAGATVTLPDVMNAFVNRETAGILHMAAVDRVAQCAHLSPGFVLKRDPPHGLQINAGDLLALPKISDSFFALCSSDAIGDAPAHAAAIEPHHQARLFRRAAMHE